MTATTAERARAEHVRREVDEVAILALLADRWSHLPPAPAPGEVADAPPAPLSDVTFAQSRQERPATAARRRPRPSRVRAGHPMPSPAPSRLPARPRLRLSRRGRLLLVLVVAGLAFAAFSAGRVSVAHAIDRHQLHRVTVAAGQTLWDVAVQVAPHADPRVTVAELEAANHLPGGAVLAGQSLVVPAS